MKNLYFDETIAQKIYQESADMEFFDHEETARQEIQLINEALEKIYSYANHNNDFLALYSALYNIYGE